MKKKIVYISGADIFDVKDVQAAFDEVRNTLNLDSDTILFGVPVDSDCESNTCVETVVPDPVAVAEDIEIMPETAPQEIPQSTESADATVVPILSVLGVGTDEVSDSCESPVDTAKPEINTIDAAPEPDIEQDITEMLDDDLPLDSSEKTLEELLETMAPLDEDVHAEPVTMSKTEPETDSVDETDATLENLASEFATAQIKMPTAKKGSERGRIGKLKNILPFKKMKRDDTGLMGDLFGWAGVAANDEDFTIPGFFTNAVGNK